MDATDYKIIQILVEDGRISMKELARKVSLSPPAAAERVKRLEDSQIISGYKAVIDYGKLGKNINVLINLDMKVENTEKFMKFISKEDSIVECHHVTGPYCKIMKARLNDIQSLERLIQRIQRFGNTETFIILSSVVKEKIDFRSN
ncbi:MAG TPA: Lrp/AsnC family transcriptional regulator [Clostridium sp.]|jgi:Lrp/AsnC family leucine-responsive transcriptional regulator|uniref:Lrp/AsnC family transcriptional regulator n=1 Tax=Clostridium lapidicellarium TaxID=3240931 RepID=A0ABV4E138_9CLOT|nr:Lrp/AsnC family transcriptional regulator [uncultured Clostridium sp.]NLU08990.1 Lrp/AsnC family transcriptional regulator [Clostridiales bacterium]HBC95354.1 Lrp/AsnC family transcriptional regulator [Clostridium sp.]